MFFNETWISKTENFNLDINSYFSEHISRNKSTHTYKGRYSGGISFYCNSEYKKYVQVIEKQQCGILWVKISNELFNFDEDIYVCHLYIPPNNSKIFTTSEIDLFEQLELGIVKYQRTIGPVSLT